ncbi:helix-turn-helix domain-containing protein [Nocardia africana]|uniref:Helix-turn-helix domain-containing protein n=1 Tax=Nocardia africana TaxID=134964 RepID=A0ABW6NH46_9NOCA
MTSPRVAVGQLIRRRRGLARRSQMELAHAVGISPRHLSFVELGKSNPSRWLLMSIARQLDLPLRERNDWLLAAGYAPRYPETSLTGPALSHILRSLQALLDSHDPFPGAVIDRGWNVRLTNRAARRLVSGIPEDVRGVPTNIFRTALHPAGLASRTRNFPQWSAYLLSRLDRTITRTQDPALTTLADEIATWPAIPQRHTWSRLSCDDTDDPVLSWQVSIDGEDLSLFTILSSFGTPMDLTLSELSIELFFPTDEKTEHALRRHARTDAGSVAR